MESSFVFSFTSVFSLTGNTATLVELKTLLEGFRTLFFFKGDLAILLFGDGGNSVTPSSFFFSFSTCTSFEWLDKSLSCSLTITNCGLHGLPLLRFPSGWFCFGVIFLIFNLSAVLGDTSKFVPKAAASPLTFGGVLAPALSISPLHFSRNSDTFRWSSSLKLILTVTSPWSVLSSNWPEESKILFCFNVLFFFFMGGSVLLFVPLSPEAAFAAAAAIAVSFLLRWTRPLPIFFFSSFGPFVQCDTPFRSRTSASPASECLRSDVSSACSSIKPFTCSGSDAKPFNFFIFRGSSRFASFLS